MTQSASKGPTFTYLHIGDYVSTYKLGAETNIRSVAGLLREGR